MSTMSPSDWGPQARDLTREESIDQATLGWHISDREKLQPLLDALKAKLKPDERVRRALHGTDSGTSHVPYASRGSEGKPGILVATDTRVFMVAFKEGGLRRAVLGPGELFLMSKGYDELTEIEGKVGFLAGSVYLRADFIFPLERVPKNLVDEFVTYVESRRDEAVSRATSSPTPASTDKYGQLEALNRLRTSGALTEAEFEAEKAQVLGHPGPSHSPEHQRGSQSDVW